LIRLSERNYITIKKKETRERMEEKSQSPA